jgi:hypothetical protein
LGKKYSEPNVSTEMDEKTEVTQKEGANTGFRYIQIVKRRKFKEEWCKEMKCVSFNHSTGAARCEICALFSELTDCNSKVLNVLVPHWSWKLLKGMSHFST